jgi:hypothetical protein
MLSLVSCANNDSTLPELDEDVVVMKYGDYTINEKEFMYILTNVKTEVVMLYEYYYGYNEEQTLSSKIGDKTVADAIKEEAVNRAQKMLIIEKLADEAGITISNQEDIAAVDEYMSNIEYAYGGKDLFDVALVKFGFSRKGIERFAKSSLLEQLVIEQRYGENGLAKIPSETVHKEFLDNFLAYEAGAFSYVNESTAAYIKYDYTDAEILDFYKKNYVRVRQVLYSKDNKSEAEADFEKISKGEIEFKDISSKNKSVKYEFVFAKDGSNFGESFEKPVLEMNVDEFKMIESDSGYHIVEKLELDTTVFDGNEASAKSAKDEVVIQMSKNKIFSAAEDLKGKLTDGELKEFPKTVEGFSNYVKIEKNFINKSTGEYNDRLDLISSLKIGEYGIYNSNTEGVYIYKRVDFNESDITASLYSEIETALISVAFNEYYVSYFDSIEVDNDILGKFDVVTIPLLEEDFYMVG